MKKPENHGKSWSDEDESFLEEHWGRYSVPKLAKRLKRTPGAITEKARMMELGGTSLYQGFLTAKQLGKAVGVSNKTVITYWIGKYGLKATKMITCRVLPVYQIDIKNFWRWAKCNQDKFDARKIEPLILGLEPAWLEEKRKADRRCPPVRYNKVWSAAEERQLLSMIAQGMKYKEIEPKLGRTIDAITNHVKTMKAEGRKEACK